MVSRNFGIHYNPEAPFDGEEDKHLMGEPPNDSGWWLTVLLVLLTAVVLLGFVVYAFGHAQVMV